MNSFPNLRSRGFTLIELLVVIAIIGILSAVVLASLSTARQKGQDAATQADINTIQTQAELYYNNSGFTYGADTNCTAGMFTDTAITNAVKAVRSNAGGSAVGCHATGNAYQVSGKSISQTSPQVYFCTDNTGFAGTTTVAVTTSSTKCGT